MFFSPKFHQNFNFSSLEIQKFRFRYLTVQDQQLKRASGGDGDENPPPMAIAPALEFDTKFTKIVKNGFVFRFSTYDFQFCANCFLLLHINTQVSF